MVAHAHDNQSPDTRARAPVSLVCDVRQGQRPWMKVQLRNISPGGFCMDWMPALEVSRSLWIRVAGLNLIQAHIRWKRDALVGCEFTAPLYDPVFDHIVLQSGRAG